MNLDSADPRERREHHRVREVFERCCALLAPLVTANASARTVSDYGMAQMVIGYFPEITSVEAHIVILTVQKMHRDDRLQALLSKIR